MLALLHDIVLEDTRRLWVVAIQSIEDLLHVIRPLRREVERGAHGGCVDERRRVGVEGLVKFAQCDETAHWPPGSPASSSKKLDPAKTIDCDKIYQFTPSWRPTTATPQTAAMTTPRQMCCWVMRQRTQRATQFPTSEAHRYAHCRPSQKSV